MTNASMQLSAARIDYLKKRKKQKTKLHNYLLVFSILAVLVFIGLLITTIVNFDHLFGEVKQPGKKEGLRPNDYVEKTVQTSTSAVGYLSLINSTHEYPATAEPEDLTSIYDGRNPLVGGEYSYKVSNKNLFLRSAALTALNSMMDAFYEATGERDAIVTSAYRSYADQEASGSSIPAGQSDSHAGLSVCLKVYKDSKTYTLTDASVAEKYHWLYENAYKYGFIVRYPTSKTSITGVSDYDYFFRYVGVEHAYYMQKNNLCLEEYVELLHQYTLDTEQLTITIEETNQTYQVYYIPSTKDTTVLRLPQNATYSGDNAGGFIVTTPKN